MSLLTESCCLSVGAGEIRVFPLCQLPAGIPLKAAIHPCVRCGLARHPEELITAFWDTDGPQVKEACAVVYLKSLIQQKRQRSLLIESMCFNTVIKSQLHEANHLKKTSYNSNESSFVKLQRFDKEVKSKENVSNDQNFFSHSF